MALLCRNQSLLEEQPPNMFASIGRNLADLKSSPHNSRHDINPSPSLYLWPRTQGDTSPIHTICLVFNPTSVSISWSMGIRKQSKRWLEQASNLMFSYSYMTSEVELKHSSLWASWPIRETRNLRYNLQADGQHFYFMSIWFSFYADLSRCSAGIPTAIIYSYNCFQT